MQLKRESDYALRILLCIGRRNPEKRERGKGMSLLEICSETGVPRAIGRRLCRRLEAGRMVAIRQSSGNQLLYFPGEKLYESTLWNVLSASEAGVNLFAVFDRSTALYRSQGEQLDRIQKELEEILRRTSLQELLDGERTTAPQPAGNRNGLK